MVKDTVQAKQWLDKCYPDSALSAPESNRQSVEWTTKGENRLKLPKPQMSAGKVLASIFWDERKNHQ